MVFGGVSNKSLACKKRRGGFIVNMMDTPKRHAATRMIWPVIPLLVSACGSLSDRSARSMPQKSDTATGSTQLLASTLRSTAVSTVRQPYTTVRTGLAVLWHRPLGIISGNLPLPRDSSQPAEVPGTEEFERLLDRRRLPYRENGRLTWLVDGPGFFPEFDRQLAAAKESVRIQLFIYDNDDVAVRYADRLKAKSETVPVRVLYDDLGSTFAHTAAPKTPAPNGFTPPADMTKYLKSDSKVEVRRSLNPWLVCDHTKLIVFDREVAMIGGMNMGREYYSEWHDLMVKIEGPVVGSLSREFGRSWRKAGPLGDLAMLRRPRFFRAPAPVDGGYPLRMLRTDAAAGTEQVMKATLLGIRAARKRVWIENPYFADDDIAREVEAAARRGVDVRVILPAKGDSGIMDSGNLGTARGLIEAGAKVYRYPRMTHMKVILCDGWGQVGSANLDLLSLRINRELNLAFSDPGAVRELERKVFQPDFRASRQIRHEETKVPMAPIAEAVADQL